MLPPNGRGDHGSWHVTRKALDRTNGLRQGRPYFFSSALTISGTACFITSLIEFLMTRLPN